MHANYNSEGERTYGGSTLYEYDANGTKILEVIYDENGNKVIEYKYDEHGNEVETIPTEGYEYTLCKTVNEYDSNGNLIRKTSFLDGFELSSTEYVYDANSNVISETTHLNEGEVKSSRKTTRAYNAAGELVELCYYDETGNVNQREEWDLESNTKKVYSASMNGNEPYLSSYIQYDEAGRELFVAQYYENGQSYFNKKYRYECVYDELGNEIQVDKYSAGELMTRTTRVFY